MQLLFIINNNLKINDFKIDILYTPGHTEGSICLKYDNYLFTGDLLFKGSIGGIDKKYGNETDFYNSIEKILDLDDKIVVLPGHGNPTTIGDERITFNDKQKE